MSNARIKKLNNEIFTHLEKVAEGSAYLWERGWAERNAGNISIDLTDVSQGIIPSGKALERHERLPIGGLPAEAAGKVYYVTGTGERLRELRDPEQVGAIILIEEGANTYRVLWGGAAKPVFKPTSEFPAHVLVHLQKSERTMSHRVVVHTHPIELIALTHHPSFTSDGRELTRRLWSMIPEVRAFIPKGIGVVPYILPGSIELAKATAALAGTYDVVLWSKHGALATGTDVLSAFDYLDVANKGAIIYMRCLAAGFEPLGMTDIEMDELARAFKL